MSKVLTDRASEIALSWHRRLERIEHVHHFRPHLTLVHSVRLPGKKGFLDFKQIGSGDIIGFSETSKKEAAEIALALYDEAQEKKKQGAA